MVNLLSIIAAFALFASSRETSAATLEFDYPAHQLTNGVCLWLEPLLDTAITSDAMVTVTISKLPTTEGKLFLKVGARWLTEEETVSRKAAKDAKAPDSARAEAPSPSSPLRGKQNLRRGKAFSSPSSPLRGKPNS